MSRPGNRAATAARLLAAILFLAAACGGAVRAGGDDYDGSPETSATPPGPSDATVDAHFGSPGAARAGPDGGCDPWPSTGAFCCLDKLDAGDDSSVNDASDTGAAFCLPFDSGWWNCPNIPCPPGSICSVEIGSAGPPAGNQSWCIPIPPACAADASCACMSQCACTHAASLVIGEQCYMEWDGSVIACDNGLR